MVAKKVAKKGGVYGGSPPGGREAGSDSDGGQTAVADCEAVQETTEGRLLRYEGLFEELTRFTSLIEAQDAEIRLANVVVAEAKEQYEDAKRKLAECESIRDGAKHDAAIVLLCDEHGGSIGSGINVAIRTAIGIWAAERGSSAVGGGLLGRGVS